MADIRKIKIGTAEPYDIRDSRVDALDVSNVGNVSAADSNNKVTLKNIKETDGLISSITTNSATVYNVTGVDALVQGAKDYTYSKSDIDSKDAATFQSAKEYADGKVAGTMHFKGTLGTGGTITALPTAAAGTVGDMYKVITAGTYASIAAKVGDTFVCSSAPAWELIPSGDDIEDTWRQINVNGSSFKGTGTSTGLVNFKNGTNVTLSTSGNDLTITAKDTTYSAGDGLALNGTTFNVGKASTSEAFLKVNADNISVEGVQDAIDTAEQNAKNHADAKTRTVSSGLKADGSTEIVSEASATKLTLGDSGVTAGEYGPTSNQTPGYGSTFNVPDIKVNAKGVVTSVVNRTVKIPASDNINTAHDHSAGVGLVGSGSAGTSGTYNYKVALASETLDTNAAVSRPSADANRIYPVIPDKNGKLAAIVPWTDGSAAAEIAAKQYADAEDAKQYAVSNGNHTHTITAKAPVYKVNPTSKHLTASASNGAVSEQPTQYISDLGTATKEYLVTNSIAVGGMVTDASFTKDKDVYNASYDETNECLVLTPATLTFSATKNAAAITYATGAAQAAQNSNASFVTAYANPTKSKHSHGFTQPTITLADTANSGGVTFVSAVADKAVAYEACTDITVSTTGAHEHTIDKR